MTQDGQNPDIQVQPTGDGDRKVTRRGQQRAVARISIQAQAVDRARDVARRDKTELSVHGRNGQVRDKWSYGNDPRSTKG